MSSAHRTQATDSLGDSARHGGHAHATLYSPPAPPSINPELVKRFHALVEDVTDQLMEGQQVDRQSCRADAITLLIASNQQIAPAEPAESPLMYLLMEEQHRAAALMARAGTAGPALTYLKA